MIEEKIIKKDLNFKGNIVDFMKYTVILPDGNEATRDVVVHPGASVVIPINEHGEVYLVKQYRAAVEETLLELPAGKLDKGEEPIKCAIRELKEETGLEAKNMKKVASILTTPGFTNEILHLFVATELTEGEACLDENEFLFLEKYKISDLINKILMGKIKDAKTIIGIFLAEKLFSDLYQNK